MDKEVGWLELPDHILSLIAIKLNHTKDYIRFGAVCQSWQSVYTENRQFMSRKPPLLMLATELNHDDQTRSLYSLAEKKVVDSRVQVPHNRHCPGSSHGWLVIVNHNWDITLFNPFSSVNNRIQLPSAKTFKCHPKSGSAVEFKNFLGFVGKIVLSANPTLNPNFVTVAIYSDFRRLAFCKPGDKVWTDTSPEYTTIKDIVYYENQFYFVNFVGMVFVCDLNDPLPRVSQVGPLLDCPRYANKRYLVESFGELLQVCRNTDFDGDLYYNDGFSVYKLDRVGVKWIKMDNLYGHVLFVGDNTSYSISASAFTECKPNSIYYTDDFYEGYFDMVGDRTGGPHDMGVFNLQDSRRELFYSTDTNVFIPAPIWIEPTL